MQVGRIRDSNFVYKAPAGMDNCADLHVQVYDDGEIRVMTSAWIPTPDEVKRIVAGQPIFLHIYGNGHPVVSMTVPEDDGLG